MAVLILRSVDQAYDPNPMRRLCDELISSLSQLQHRVSVCNSGNGPVAYVVHVSVCLETRSVLRSHIVLSP